MSKKVARSIYNNREKVLCLTSVVLGSELKKFLDCSGSCNKRSKSSIQSQIGINKNLYKKYIVNKDTNVIKNTFRTENDVKAHKQRYHTKDGIKWKDKDSYHRGRKDI